MVKVSAVPKEDALELRKLREELEAAKLKFGMTCSKVYSKLGAVGTFSEDYEFMVTVTGEKRGKPRPAKSTPKT